MSDPILEVDGLTVEYRTADGTVTAVSDASFTLEEGRYFGLVGESGCGKSTIAKAIIGGLDANGRITDGTVSYAGTQLQGMSDAELNRAVRWNEIAYVPQGSMSSLDPLRRISQQAAEIAAVHEGLPKRDAVERLRELFDVVGIDPDRVREYPHQFSGGMQQRALIAIALLLDPRLLIADEPTTALDVIMQDNVLGHLESLRDEVRTSMLLITHDIAVVFETCDEMAIMHSGQIAETGDVHDVHAAPRHPYSILLQRSFPDIRHPDRDLEVIPGSPPQLTGGVDRCTFADRCPVAVEECHARVPPLRQSDPPGAGGHHAACLRQDDIVAGRTEMRRSGGSER